MFPICVGTGAAIVSIGLSIFLPFFLPPPDFFLVGVTTGCGTGATVGLLGDITMDVETGAARAVVTIGVAEAVEVMNEDIGG